MFRAEHSRQPAGFAHPPGFRAEHRPLAVCVVNAAGPHAAGKNCSFFPSRRWCKIVPVATTEPSDNGPKTRKFLAATEEVRMSHISLRTTVGV
jgi:hypothetical protein